MSKIAPKHFFRIYLLRKRLHQNGLAWRRLQIIILLTSALFTVGCQQNVSVNSNANSAEILTTREITDDLGRRVRFPAKITNAVSLAPNLTEITFAVGAGDRLIGITSFCDYPAEAQKIQKIGDTLAPNIENMVALKPQIVLISTASQMENFTQTLDRQGIAYFVTNPNSLDDIYKSIYQIGEIFGTDDRAKQIVDEMKRRVVEVETRSNTAKDVRVFVQIDRNMLYTIGKDSFMNDLINRAGGESVTRDIATAYPKISKETALTLNPEAIILSESPDNQAPNEIFADSTAVKNGKIFKVNADLLSRPSPRIVDALEQISRSLHPENFE